MLSSFLSAQTVIQQYGTLRYISSGTGYEATNLSHLNLSVYESLTFKANGIEPDSFGVVKINISTTDNTIPEANVDLNIYPNIAYPLGVFFDAEKYLPGDTADIYLLKRTSQYPDFDPYNAEYTQFPSDQLFNVKIEKGREYGAILNPAASDTSKEFTGIRKGFELIVSDSAVQYYAGGWRDFGTTTNGVATKELLPNNYYFRMNYAYISNDKQQNIGTDNTVTFSTVLCTVNVLNSQNQPVDGADIQYYAGGWREIGQTVGGKVKKELLPGNIPFRMNYNSAVQNKTQDISSNSSVEFNTGN